MRRHLILPLSALVAGFGLATMVSANPLERLQRARGALPIPARPSTTPAGTTTTKAGGGAQIADQGVHNAVHAAHQNQIVFTRSDTTIGAITEGDIASDFTLGQPMYFRVFTQRSAVNAIAAANGMAAGQVYADGVHYTARFTIAGQSFDTTIFPWGNRRDHETWTTWRGQFINPGNAQRTPGSDAFLEMLSRATSAGLLAPGRHVVKMELVAKTNTEKNGPISAGVVASGTFNLTVPAGIFKAGNPGVCGPGRGAASSPALEARALAHARQFWDWPDMTPVKATGVSGEFKIERNELTGIPIERSSDMVIYARGPKFCSANRHSFNEKYAGGGTWAPGGISVNFTPGYVPCGCLS
ncbi:MAG: hypothetical protein ACKOPQ_15100 [Novosphingobium sp.]